MQVGTPTWRAHPEGLARQGFAAPGDLARVNTEAVTLLMELRRQLALEDRVLIAGVVGPLRDGYDASDAPDATAAEAYHRPQSEVLAHAGVDLLYGPTFASAEEMVGLARAFAATGVPYALAPIIGADGCLRDGTPLADLIARIDDAVTPPPMHFLIGCVHPSHVAEARATPAWPRSNRVAGLKANASPLPPEALDGSDHLQASDIVGFVGGMSELHRAGLRILGGCCGTGAAHIRALAHRFTAEAV
jgi:homocysteine S-methyltransferase